jgi:hypothetical protein
MNAYEATLATAKLFEQRPKMFDFSRVYVPLCDTPGCAIGYIEHFMGFEGVIDGNRSLGTTRTEFYKRMSELVTSKWKDSASICAAGLRLYAEKYLREDYIPIEVRAVFEREPSNERVRSSN